MKPKYISLLRTSCPTVLGVALVLLSLSCSRHSEVSSSVLSATASSPNTDTKPQSKNPPLESGEKISSPASSASPTSPASSISSASPAKILWSGGFQEANWKAQWGIQNDGAWGEENMEAIADSSGRFAKVLRVRYPKNSASPSVSRKEGVPIGGGQFYANLGIAPKDVLRLSYYIRFSENFDFVKGGKLPGLYGGDGNSGGDIPDGTDGFSTRFMWRTNGDGEVYAYLPTSQKDGTSIGRGEWKFTPGVWYRLEQEVTLNQPGKANGRVRVWLNEQPVLDESGLTFRTIDALKIEGVFFSTFFGGGDSSWATPKDVYADFADFNVSEVQSLNSSTTPDRSSTLSETTKPQSSSSVPTTTPPQLTVTLEKKSDWETGFCTNIQVTNQGNTSVRNWQVAFQMEQATIKKSWNGTFKPQGSQYVATPLERGQAIAPGRSRKLGFCADKLGADYQPQKVSVSVR